MNTCFKCYGSINCKAFGDRDYGDNCNCYGTKEAGWYNDYFEVKMITAYPPPIGWISPYPGAVPPKATPPGNNCKVCGVELSKYLDAAYEPHKQGACVKCQKTLKPPTP